MGSIAYTVLREIEKLPYLKTGTDISAAAADNSFNAVTTDLSGLLDNQWIDVTGFTDPANLGFFQASAASTTLKILQDSATLVIEAAGANITLQGHVRGLNQLATLEFGVQEAQRRVAVQRTSKPAIGGAMETILKRRDELWQVTTDFIAEADLPQWREFLASVEGGESFTLDPYGTVAAPVLPLVVSLESSDYTEQRLAGRFASRLYTFDFDARVVV